MSPSPAAGSARPAAPLSAYLYLAGGMSVVGAYVGFSKVIVETVPVFLLASIRFGIAAIALLPWTFPRGGLAIAWPQKKTLLGLSFFGNFLFSIFMLSGVARTSATAAGLIMSMIPAAVAVFSLFMLGERINGRAMVAIALAVIGVGALTLVRTQGSEAAPVEGAGVGDALIGNAFIVGAVCCEAIFVVLGKRLTTASVGPMQIAAWMNLVGLALMLPMGIWQGVHFDFLRIKPTLWILIACYALGASVLSTWLWLTGLKHVPASQAGVFTTALPVASALVGIVFLGERPTIVHAIAFGCALAGILLMTRARR
ncbi:MAG: DMT family transporter [Burkholderiaceae bacterium]